MSREVPIEQARPEIANLTGPVLALAGLSLSAGTIHLVATAQHLDVVWTLPAFFAIIGAGQLYVAWATYRRPHDRELLVAAAIGNLIIGLLWLVSRTVGLPFGPEEGTQGIGVSDTIASLQEFAFAWAAIGMVRAPERTARRLAWLAGPMGLRVSFMLLSSMLFVAAIGGHKH